VKAEVAGGFGIFNKSGLERMFRDARLGRMHPAKTTFGIGLDENPRWG